MESDRRGAYIAGKFLVVCSVAHGLLSLVGGIVLATVKDSENCGGFFEPDCGTPYVAYGLAVTFTGIFIAAFAYAIGKYIVFKSRYIEEVPAKLPAVRETSPIREPNTPTVKTVNGYEIKHHANLSGVNLVAAKLSGVNLSGANLSDANLSDADLRYANLTATKLLSADLTGANLEGANMNGANLSGANLSTANLSGANLSTANLNNANLSGATMPDGTIHD